LKYVVYYGDEPSEALTAFQINAPEFRYRRASGIVSALTSLEKQFFTDIDSVHNATRKCGANRERVTFIGAGLVNLISAHFAVKAGMLVSFVDAGPDPRSGRNWQLYGCSAGGANARMFTLSEMDNYNCRQVHDDMNWQFSRSVENLGWNVHSDGSLTKDEMAWIDTFESVPAWLADSYNQDIFKFNRESKSLWEQWIAEDPELFDESFIVQDILRVYSDFGHYQKSLARQDQIGATIRAVSGAEIAVEQPILRSAVDGGLIAGGVYVHGFTVNIHRFISHLIGRLESYDATFEWNRKMVSIRQDHDGVFDGVTLDNGEIIRDNIVISPGAYSNGSLGGTSSHSQIAGVLGAWLTLPDLGEGLNNSLKLARKGHIVEDANVTVALDENGTRVAIIGSGYGFTGFSPANIDKSRLDHIYDGIIDTAKKYFNEGYSHLVESGTLRNSLKYCVRPWTPTGLGLFETLKTQKDSKLIVVGGHNTGGFAQAPAIGMAVIASLRNRRHDMHRDYHPDRFLRFAS
jgi:glycine/D-amino acid oxidase-like deaminating enzyme